MMRFWMRDLICHNLWNIQVNSVSSKSFDWGWRPYTSFLFVVHIKPTENMRGLQLQPWFHPYQHSIRFVFGTQYVCSWGCNLKRPFGTIGFFLYGTCITMCNIMHCFVTRWCAFSSECRFLHLFILYDSSCTAGFRWVNKSRETHHRSISVVRLP